MKITKITTANDINFLYIQNENLTETRLRITDNQLKEILNNNEHTTSGNSIMIIYAFKK